MPSDATATLVGMLFLARLICSDPECAERAEEEAETLEELAAFACECGCGFEVLAIRELEPAA